VFPYPYPIGLGIDMFLLYVGNSSSNKYVVRNSLRMSVCRMAVYRPTFAWECSFVVVYMQSSRYRLFKFCDYGVFSFYLFIFGRWQLLKDCFVFRCCKILHCTRCRNFCSKPVTNCSVAWLFMPYIWSDRHAIRDLCMCWDLRHRHLASVFWWCVPSQSWKMASKKT